MYLISYIRDFENAYLHLKKKDLEINYEKRKNNNVTWFKQQNNLQSIMLDKMQDTNYS